MPRPCPAQSTGGRRGQGPPRTRGRPAHTGQRARRAEASFGRSELRAVWTSAGGPPTRGGRSVRCSGVPQTRPPGGAHHDNAAAEEGTCSAMGTMIGAQACVRGGGEAMRQRILGLHTPPCHRHMVITTLSSMFCLGALQHKPDQGRGGEGGGLGMSPSCVVLVCIGRRLPADPHFAAPSLEPSPSVGGGAHRPLTPLVSFHLLLGLPFPLQGGWGGVGLWGGSEIRGFVSQKLPLFHRI